ncbi:hypothetical protein D3C71_2063320 [compost metagenome]
MGIAPQVIGYLDSGLRDDLDDAENKQRRQPVEAILAGGGSKLVQTAGERQPLEIRRQEIVDEDKHQH